MNGFNTSVQNTTNGKYNYNGNSKRKFLSENINNIEIEIIRRSYLNDLYNNYSKFHHFEFKLKDKDYNRNRNSYYDNNSRFNRTDPQPLFSQNVNYNVPTKKLFLNNETNPVNHQNRNTRRKNYKNKSKKNEQKYVNKNENENQTSTNPSVAHSINGEIIIRKEIELDDINPNKLINIAPTTQVTIDENLIKLDLHKTQQNKRPTSLYENFVKSATKKPASKNISTIDNLELNLSNLSLSSNENSSTTSKMSSASKQSRGNSIFDVSNLKKSESFGHKSSKDSLNEIHNSSANNLRPETKESIRKKNRKKNRKNNSQAQKPNEDEFDFSNTNEFWEDEEHLVIGQDYLNYDSELDFDFEFDMDKE